MFFFSHLPPSQGGKYSGFGNSVAPPPKTQSQEILDATLSSLASVSIFNETVFYMAKFGSYINSIRKISFYQKIFFSKMPVF